MASYRLSADAEADFAAIYRYSLVHHGEAQADRYGVSLIEAFEMLAESPMAGKVEDSVLADARCLIHELHSIYYWLEGDVVVIDRILHQMQDPLRHL